MVHFQKKKKTRSITMAHIQKTKKYYISFKYLLYLNIYYYYCAKKYIKSVNIQNAWNYYGITMVHVKKMYYYGTY